MRVLVCGGRNYLDRRAIYDALDDLSCTMVIHGGARGADMLAGEWAQSRLRPQEIFEAEWGKYGNAAGPIRNQKMIDEGKPELVLAFPGGRGTADIVSRAKAAGIEVCEVN